LDFNSSLSERRGVADTAGFDVQNALAAAFAVDAITNRLQVDLRAGISQQAISAFGEQRADGDLAGNRNRSEVRTVTVAPFAHGPIGGIANYEVRLDGTATRSQDPQGVDSNASGGSFVLRSPDAGALLGWTIQGSRSGTRYENQLPVEDRRLSAGLSATPAVDLRLSVRAGRESVAQGTAGDPTWTNTVGGGLQWTPSPRTNLSIDTEDRYFGRSGRVGLQHRMPRSILTYSFSRDASRSADARAGGSPLTLYDLLYAQTPGSLDAAARDALVRDLLRQTGQDPNQSVPAGPQISTVSVARRQDLSFVWLGQRATLTVQGYTSATQPIFFSSIADPVLGEPTRQNGYSGSLSYRLTPLSSLLLGGSRQMTFATGTQSGNDLKTAYATLNHSLGLQTTVILGTRYTVFNSSTDPYRETTVTASLNLRF
jgi:uncharacterized protein (PEP-CTERM system associated)